MSTRIPDAQSSIDSNTLRSISRAIGDRLQQHLSPDSSEHLPSSLQRLLDEMRRRENEGSPSY